MEGAPAFGAMIFADLAGEGSHTGKALKGGVDYNVSYPKGMKNVGKYTVKVTFKENYSGGKSVKLYSGWSKAKSVTTKK